MSSAHHELTPEAANELTLRAIEAYEGRVDRDNPHVTKYPPDVQPALELLWKLWHFRAPPKPRGNRGGQYAFWIDATRELVDICGGELESVLRSIYRAQVALPASKRLSLVGPQSLIGLARAEMGRRLASRRNKDDPAYWHAPPSLGPDSPGPAHSPPGPDSPGPDSPGPGSLGPAPQPSEPPELEPPELEAMRAELKRRQEAAEAQPMGFDVPSAEAAIREIRALAERWRAPTSPRKETL